MKPKYNIGDKVKFHRHGDEKAGEIISFTYVPESKTFRYTFTSGAYDAQTNSMIEGVRHCLEDEIILEGEKPTKDEK